MKKTIENRDLLEKTEVLDCEEVDVSPVRDSMQFLNDMIVAEFTKPLFSDISDTRKAKKEVTSIVANYYGLFELLNEDELKNKIPRFVKLVLYHNKSSIYNGKFFNADGSVSGDVVKACDHDLKVIIRAFENMMTGNKTVLEYSSEQYFTINKAILDRNQSVAVSDSFWSLIYWNRIQSITLGNKTVVNRINRSVRTGKGVVIIDNRRLEYDVLELGFFLQNGKMMCKMFFTRHGHSNLYFLVFDTSGTSSNSSFLVKFIREFYLLLCMDVFINNFFISEALMAPPTIENLRTFYHNQTFNSLYSSLVDGIGSEKRLDALNVFFESCLFFIADLCISEVLGTLINKDHCHTITKEVEKIGVPKKEE